jgi:hypothetical protein
MDERIRSLRAQVARFTESRPPTAVRYPAAFRIEVLALARRRRAHGVGVARIARELARVAARRPTGLRQQRNPLSGGPKTSGG